MKIHQSCPVYLDLIVTPITGQYAERKVIFSISAHTWIMHCDREYSKNSKCKNKVAVFLTKCLILVQNRPKQQQLCFCFMCSEAENAKPNEPKLQLRSNMHLLKQEA